MLITEISPGKDYLFLYDYGNADAWLQDFSTLFIKRVGVHPTIVCKNRLTGDYEINGARLRVMKVIDVQDVPRLRGLRWDHVFFVRESYLNRVWPMTLGIMTLCSRGGISDFMVEWSPVRRELEREYYSKQRG